MASQFHLKIRWITRALKTITSEHRFLQQISIHIFYWVIEPENVRLAFREEIYQEWMDLDSILVQICQSHTCCVKAELYPNLMEIQGHHGMRMHTNPMDEYINDLLPEMKKRGLIVVVHHKNIKPIS